MTKREKKYQRRLFAEMHLNKYEQIIMIETQDSDWYKLYREYRFCKTTGTTVGWMAGIAFSKMARRMSQCNVSMGELSSAVTLATKSLGDLAYAAREIARE